jgi:crooked neck
VLEAWAQCARERGDQAALERIGPMMPKRVKKKRAIVADDGTDGGWEEYYDYIYPDETAAQPSLKILEMAHKWKRQRGDDE